MREAAVRKKWVSRELAALRAPGLTLLREPELARTFAEAATRWQASRVVDVAEATKVQHRTALNRALPILATTRIGAITRQDVADLVAVLHGEGKSRESIRRTVTALAKVSTDQMAIR